MLVYVVTDRRLRLDLSLERLIDTVTGAGADMIQIREKDLTAGSLLACARRSLAIRASSGPDLFLNGRPDVALASGAQGVHLPAAGLPAAEVKARWGGRLRVGVSTHTLEEAVAAVSAGADFITFGPVFPTESKRPYGPPSGVSRLREVVSAASLPVFAIGGIDRTRMEELAGIPIAGVAVISAVLLSHDMAAAIRELHGARG